MSDTKWQGFVIECEDEAKYSEKTRELFAQMQRSDNPVEASAGRLLELMAPAVHTWLKGEQNIAGVTPAVTSRALGKACVTEIASHVLSIARPGKHQVALARFADILHADIHKIADDETLPRMAKKIEAWQNDGAEGDAPDCDCEACKGRRRMAERTKAATHPSTPKVH